MLKGICGDFVSFYFIGVGGVSMSALARLLAANGKRVGGSDAVSSVYTEELISEGIKVTIGSAESVAEYEAVVYTDAIGENDPQLSEAKRLGKFLLPRGRLLSEVCENFKTTIAISGCHGKTTCTAMLAHIFKASAKKFCAHIGGRDLVFTNFYLCGDDYFITEACEYKKNFLLLNPDISVILNSRPDHLECYGSEENLKACYAQFCGAAKTSICLYGDGFKQDLTFGFDRNADYYAKNIYEAGGVYSFTACEGGMELGRVCLEVYGKHNVLNALAAIAVARCAGIPFTKIRAGLEEFKGVERRFEKIAKINGAVWIADYAHHPDELRASIRTATKITAGGLYIIFQPHTYSRTRLLFKQFVRVLAPRKNLMVYRTYAAREYFDDAGSAFTLASKLKNSVYGEEPADMAKFALKAGERDTVLFLGAGDIYEIAKMLAQKINGKR